MLKNNEMTLKFKALSENESFARVCIASFLASVNPTIDELSDIKTAVSEAVTNCVVHAYPNVVGGEIEMNAKVVDNSVYISITDKGIGIEDINKAKQPFYTTKQTSERSGMGFTVMEGFVDKLVITSEKNKGTKIEMYKTLNKIGEVAFGV